MSYNSTLANGNISKDDSVIFCFNIWGVHLESTWINEDKYDLNKFENVETSGLKLAENFEENSNI